MRAIALLLLVVLTGCAAGEPETPIFIDDFTTRSSALACEPVPILNSRNASIGNVVTSGDTSFLVLYDEELEVAVVGPDLEVKHRIALEEDGPAGVRMPKGVALLRDSILVVADQLGTKLQRLDLRGKDLGAVDLDFAPQGLSLAGGRLLITPFVIGNYPKTLLFALDQEDRAEPLPVTTARYRDGLVNTFANTAHVATFPDGRIVVTHLLMIPFAQVLTLDSTSPARFPLPLPDGVRERYGWVPTRTVTEDDSEKLLFPVIASAADSRTGDLIYLTKTGRANGAGSEKALIRVDRDLRYLRSYLLDVNATRLAYLPGQELALIATPNDEWYRCHVP